MDGYILLVYPDAPGSRTLERHLHIALFVCTVDFVPFVRSLAITAVALESLLVRQTVNVRAH